MIKLEEPESYRLCNACLKESHVKISFGANEQAMSNIVLCVECAGWLDSKLRHGYLINAEIGKLKEQK